MLIHPTDADDAVTRRYVASRFQALSDKVQEIGGKKGKLDALYNLLGVENNQVLLMTYELNTDIQRRGFSNEYEKLPHYPNAATYQNYLDAFTLNNNFYHIYLKLHLLNVQIGPIYILNSLEHIPYILILIVLVLLLFR